MKGAAAGQTPSWVWSEAAAKAFQKLKDAFKSAPLLRHFDPALPLMVITDASGFAYAAILLQPRGEPGTNNHWHPIAFYSKKFSDCQTRYTTHDKELMAI